MNRNFKVVSELSEPIGSTVLNESAARYLGGTAKGGEYNFVYQVKSSFMMETVDFNAKTVRDSKLFEVPESREGPWLPLQRQQYLLFHRRTDDRSGRLDFLFSVDAGGQLAKNIPFPHPAGTIQINIASSSAATCMTDR